MRSNVLPKEEPSKDIDLGSEVSVKRMNGKMHESINMIDITLKSKTESIDTLLAKLKGVV